MSAPNATVDCSDAFLFFPCDWSKVAAIGCFVGVILLLFVISGVVGFACWRLARRARQRPSARRIYARSVPTISVIGDLCAETPEQSTRYSSAATLPRDDRAWKTPTQRARDFEQTTVEYSPYSHFAQLGRGDDKMLEIRSSPGDVTFRDSVGLTTFASGPRYSQLSQLPVDQTFSVTR
uniref:Uncharacterized protein n=1 Tax=Plectus sambesii TaxID=2011161 RepID=A0A914V2W9_9BILA